MSVAALDRAALLSWLRTRSMVGKPLVQAVYAGLGERVERGDFDVKKEPQTGVGKVNYNRVISAGPGSVATASPGPSTTPLEKEVAVFQNTMASPSDRPET